MWRVFHYEFCLFSPYNFMYKKQFTVNFVKKKKTQKPKKWWKMQFGENYNFSIILDELTIFTNMKSQSNCARRSHKVVGLSLNLEIIDTRF